MSKYGSLKQKQNTCENKVIIEQLHNLNIMRTMEKVYNKTSSKVRILVW